MLRALLFLTASAAAAAARLVGLYHAPGDASSCSLITVDPTTGANTTLSPTTVCDGLVSDFPAYAAADAATNTLFVAVSGAATAFAVDILTGASAPLAALANDPADDLVGAAFIPGAGFLVVLQSGVYNATAPGAPASLIVALDDWPAAVVASAPGGGTGGAGRLFVANRASTAIRVVDLGAPRAAPVALRGVAKPMDVAFDAERLYEVASYRLSVISAKAGGGAPALVTPLPDGPGFPSAYGFVEPGVFFFQDFNNTFTVNIAKKAVTKLDAPFVGASRRVGQSFAFADAR